MAISLNNHESRIQSLESRTGYYSESILLYDNHADKTVTLQQDINNFELMRVVHSRGEAGKNYTGASTFVIPVSDFIKEKTITLDYDPSSATLTYVNGTSITVRGGEKGYVTCIYGISLKLYYNFSYNIISKIILRIISSLVQKVAKSIPNFILKGGVRFGYFC